MILWCFVYRFGVLLGKIPLPSAREEIHLNESTCLFRVVIVSAKELPQDVSEALIDGDMYHCPLLTRFLTTAEAGAAAAREEREGNEDDDDDDDDEMITVAPVVALLYLRHGLFLLPLPALLCHSR